MYIRTGILDEEGRDTGIDPFMASFPHLIDVGVMGHCKHGKTGLCVKAGIECYQNGLDMEAPNMRLKDFESIARQCRGKCHQLALGGRGDPDQHEHFEELLKITRGNMLVPNFTTSGYGMTEEIAKLCRKYCGAVAVSWYRSPYTLRAIEMLLKAGVKTNVHYVISNTTIDEALRRVRRDDFPRGINAVIFLLHKPTGLGTQENVLDVNDIRVKEIFKEMDKPHAFKVGMDSCCIPGAVNFSENVNPDALDTCEGARYSCYISSDMYMVPCSFDQKMAYKVSLREKSIKEAWNSAPFEMFREKLRRACPECEKKAYCMGGCPLTPEVVLCDSSKRRVWQS